MVPWMESPIDIAEFHQEERLARVQVETIFTLRIPISSPKSLKLSLLQGLLTIVGRFPLLTVSYLELLEDQYVKTQSLMS